MNVQFEISWLDQPRGMLAKMITNEIRTLPAQMDFNLIVASFADILAAELL